GPRTVRVEGGGEGTEDAVEAAGPADNPGGAARSSGRHRLDGQGNAAALIATDDEAGLCAAPARGPGGHRVGRSPVDPFAPPAGRGRVLGFRRRPPPRPVHAPPSLPRGPRPGRGLVTVRGRPLWSTVEGGPAADPSSDRRRRPARRTDLRLGRGARPVPEEGG